MSAPVDHPPPWRWEYARDERDYETVALRDANGESLISGTDLPDAFVVEREARELVRAAPEMEAFLRRALYETQPNGVCGDIHETDDWRQLAQALLDGIDAARKAGG